MSEPTPPRQSARETRLLLLTLAVSVAALLLLARFRFPERPLADLTSPPLARLTRVTAFDELSALLGDLLRQFEGAVVLVRATTPAGFATAWSSPLSSTLPSALSSPSPASGPPRAADPTALAQGARVTPDSASVARSLDALGLLVRNDLALVPLPRGGRVDTVAGAALGANGVVARDDERGLTVVRVPGYSAPELPLQPQASPLDAPGFVAILEASADGPTIRAEFVSRYSTEKRAEWDQPVLVLGGTIRTQPGALVFALNGRFVGMTLDEPTRTLVIPAYALMARATRLANGESVRIVDAGIDVQPLTPALAKATGVGASQSRMSAATGGSGAATSPGVSTSPAPGAAAGTIAHTTTPAGVIVGAVRTLISARGGSSVDVGDVITAVDGRAIRSPRDWQQALRTHAAGTTLKLSLVRFGQPVQATLTLPRPEPLSASPAAQATSAAGSAAATPSSAAGAAASATSSPAPGPGSGRATAAGTRPSARDTLGLSLRDRASGGVDVIDVHIGGAGAHAGLQPGDWIASMPGSARGLTAASATEPTTAPANAKAIATAYAALASGQALLLAVERQGAAFVAAIEQP